MNKDKRRIQIALIALRQLAGIAGAKGAVARIALSQCNEIRLEPSSRVSVSAFAMLDSEGRFKMADNCAAPSRIKCDVSWEEK